jgi:hypothetical protein
MPNRIRPSGVHAGQRFGKLTVTVGPLTQKITAICICQCDCGAIRHFVVHNLLGGMSTSCGCSRQKSRNNLLGRVFGRLTVIGNSVRQHGRRCWPCRCECGNTLTVYNGHLLGEHTRSCGCLQKDFPPAVTHGESKGRECTVRYGLLLRAIARSKKKNVPFDLVLDDIVVPTHCPLLGIPLVKNKGQFKDNSFTIDEVIPGKGYVRGNTQVVSWRANSLKSNSTIEELDLLVKNLKLQRERLSAETQGLSLMKQQSELAEIKPQEDDFIVPRFLRVT